MHRNIYMGATPKTKTEATEMNRELLEAAMDLLRWVLIKNNGTLPLDLLDAHHTVKMEHREQTLEDIYHDEASTAHESTMMLLYGGERHE
jgi:hypothetical protein